MKLRPFITSHIILAILVLAAAVPPAAQPILTEQQKRVEKFIMEEVKIRFGKNRSEFIAGLGEPVSWEKKKFANTYRPEIQDTFHRMVFNGLTVELMELGGTGKELLYRVILNGSQYSLSQDLGIGASRSHVISTLGDPKEISSDGSQYTYTNFESTSTATLTFKDNRVDEIKWIMYVD
jgi:hypothetical protein